MTRVGQRFRLAAVAAIMVLAATACGGVSTGTALENGSVDQDGLIAIRVGTEIGMNAVWLDNVSHTPITIEAVRLVGPGVGTVLRRVRTEIAVSGRDSVPVTAYAEDPPVTLTTRGCVVQALRPVTGYRLLPGRFVTLWTILLGLRPGRYHVVSHLVTYVQGGSRFRETITQGYHGAVARHTAPLTTGDDGAGRCWRHTSHLLKGVPW